MHIGTCYYVVVQVAACWCLWARVGVCLCLSECLCVPLCAPACPSLCLCKSLPAAACVCVSLCHVLIDSCENVRSPLVKKLGLSSCDSTRPSSFANRFMVINENLSAARNIRRPSSPPNRHSHSAVFALAPKAGRLDLTSCQ